MQIYFKHKIQLKFSKKANGVFSVKNGVFTLDCNSSTAYAELMHSLCVNETLTLLLVNNFQKKIKVGPLLKYMHQGYELSRNLRTNQFEFQIINGLKFFGKVIENNYYIFGIDSNDMTQPIEIKISNFIEIYSGSGLTCDEIAEYISFCREMNCEIFDYDNYLIFSQRQEQKLIEQ